jgi:hypothetical protein
MARTAPFQISQEGSECRRPHRYRHDARLALGHLVTAVLLAVTIVGIPFAWAHLKLAGLALWPIGNAIVPVQNAPLR